MTSIRLRDFLLQRRRQAGRFGTLILVAKGSSMNPNDPITIRRIEFNPAAIAPGQENKFAPGELITEARLDVEFSDRERRTLRGERASTVEAGIRTLIG